MGRGVLLTANLPQLQNLIKRDPAGYKEEFLQQYNHYNSTRQLFTINPDDNASHFRELVTFIAQVAVCYPKKQQSFRLISLPFSSKTMAHSHQTPVKHSSRISSSSATRILLSLLKTLFPLLPRTTSSSLRAFIRKTILSDIRTANLRTKNHKLNRVVQAMLFAMVERGMDAEVLGDKGKLRSGGANGEDAMWAVVLTKELWRKQIWTDAKTVSIVALGCFHPVIKVQSASVHFFLGSDEDREDSDEESDQEVDIKALHHRRDINKKTRSGDKKLQKQLNTAKKVIQQVFFFPITDVHFVQKKYKTSESSTPNFTALQLLNDSQSFAEKLYDKLGKYDKRFSLDHKILLMQLLSRVMGSHKLFVLPFYTYILKYLTYHQLRIPAILVALAQSVHDLTPPDALTPVVKKLAAEFVHPGVGSEVIAAGINAIREVCRRQPWAIEEDLLGDLVEYKKSRDKAVTAAARGILQLYREINPGMLKKRERGKEASIGMSGGRQPLPFGHSADAAVDIEGLALLEDHLKKLREEDTGEMEEDDEAGWENWDVETDSSESDSERWIDVSSEGEDIEVSDSDDDKEMLSAKDKTKDASEVDGDTQTQETRVSTLATTKILTPADFALLHDLRIKAAEKAVESGGGSKAKRKLVALEASKKAAAGDDSADAFISENDILGPRKKAKADYAERIASIEKGREGREKYGSLKGKKKKEMPSSSTNREKARNKPIMMILSSGAVKGRRKRH
ncbi:SDA1-domain-containing protein [Chiua virens]|nr:SDA1-domain-containing protein [Chiua virens]